MYRWMFSTGRSDVNLTDFEIDLMACSCAVFVPGRSVGGEFGHIVARLSSWIENQFCHWQDLGVFLRPGFSLSVARAKSERCSVILCS